MVNYSTRYREERPKFKNLKSSKYSIVLVSNVVIEKEFLYFLIPFVKQTGRIN